MAIIVALYQVGAFHYLIIHYRDFLDFEAVLVFAGFVFEALSFLLDVTLACAAGAGAAEAPPPPVPELDGAGVPTAGGCGLALG